MANRIERFDGEFAFLSNFYPAPIEFSGRVWPTAEHLYQAVKSYNETEQEAIRLLATPGQAKRAGKKIVHFRANWDSIKVHVMETILWLKFTQNQDVANMLLATGSAKIVETNWWHDNFWGNCSCNACSMQKGQNTLGELLMKTRSKLAERR